MALQRAARCAARTALIWAAVLLTQRAMAQGLDPAHVIRQQGLQDSHAAAFVASLADGIGPRLMGSPNMRRAYDWALQNLRSVGGSNVHLEDIGEFGLSWRLDNVWLRMTTPDTAVLQGHASPWSVSSRGVRTGRAVAVQFGHESDFDSYRGKLKGRIVLLGPPRETLPVESPLDQRWSDEDIDHGTAMTKQTRYFAHVQARWAARAAERAFFIQQGEFLKKEGVLAVIVPSADSIAGHGGTGMLIVDDPPLTSAGWTRATQLPFPVMVAGIESFDRVWHLAQSGVPVALQFDLQSTLSNTHERGFNVVAEIPGNDPMLKSQVVLLGAHLDSWGAGTGAVDNGAGVAAALEVLRLLEASGAKPRRTVRIILFGAEEEGDFGSKAYVAAHYAASKAGTPLRISERYRATDLITKPGYDEVSAFYNLDHGSGRVRAVISGDNPAAARLFETWIEPLEDLGVRRVFAQRDWPNDIASFEAVGLPAVSFVQDPLDYDTRAHHSNLDTLERVSAPDLAQLATVSALLVLNTANSDERVPRSALQ